MSQPAANNGKRRIVFWGVLFSIWTGLGILMLWLGLTDIIISCQRVEDSAAPQVNCVVHERLLRRFFIREVAHVSDLRSAQLVPYADAYRLVLETSAGSMTIPWSFVSPEWQVRVNRLNAFCAGELGNQLNITEPPSLRSYMVFLGALMLGIPWLSLAIILWHDRATKK